MINGFLKQKIAETDNQIFQQHKYRVCYKTYLLPKQIRICHLNISCCNLGRFTVPLYFAVFMSILRFLIIEPWNKSQCARWKRVTKINLSARPRRSQELAETGNKGRKKNNTQEESQEIDFQLVFRLQTANTIGVASIEDDIINQPGHWGKIFAVNVYANPYETMMHSTLFVSKAIVPLIAIDISTKPNHFAFASHVYDLTVISGAGGDGGGGHR